MLNFIRGIFACIKIIVWCLSLVLFKWSITFIDLCMLTQPFTPKMQPTWSWWISFLMCCWIRFASILLRIFASMFIRDNGLNWAGVCVCVCVCVYLGLPVGWCVCVTRVCVCVCECVIESQIKAEEAPWPVMTLNVLNSRCSNGLCQLAFSQEVVLAKDCQLWW